MFNPRQTTPACDIVSALIALLSISCNDNFNIYTSTRANSFVIEAMSKRVISPNEKVTITGKNFKPSMQIEEEQETTVPSAYSVDSATTITYQVRSDSRLGPLKLHLTQDGIRLTLSLLSDGGKTDYPVMTVAPDQVCRSQSFYDGEGKLQQGTKLCGIDSCTQDGAVQCTTSSAFKAAATAHLGEKVLVNHAVAGVAGSATLPAATQVRQMSGVYGAIGKDGSGGVTPLLTDCSADGATGCVAVSTFPAADLAGLNASKLQAGITVAGVTGTLPWCKEDGEQNCRLSGKFKAGNPTTVDAWDLRAGRTLAGVAGALKMSCRNTINAASFNHDDITTLNNSADITGNSNDYWDTVDEANGFPATPVAGWSSDTYCDSSVWQDVTTIDGGVSRVACGTSNTCIYKDRITSLEVTGILDAIGNATSTTAPGSYTWSDGMRKCNSSTYGGYPAGTWRLPTQKELIELYAHGMTALVHESFISWANTEGVFLSATTAAIVPEWYRAFSFRYGNSAGWTKTIGASLICVK
jgi:hypothetical protein